MSKPLDVHSAGFAMMQAGPEGIYWARGTTVPVDGTQGFAKGCIFIDTNAAAGSIIFCNEGTVTSCDFDAVLVA